MKDLGKVGRDEGKVQGPRAGEGLARKTDRCVLCPRLQLLVATPYAAAESPGFGGAVSGRPLPAEGGVS
jgi:hypothetical protein